MISNNELVSMRDAIETLLPDTCNILEATNTADGYGGVTQSWGTTSASVACRLDIVNRRSSAQNIQGASLREYQETILSLPYDTTISNNNRVEHGGFTYNVTENNTDQSWISVKRVTLERV